MAQADGNIANQTGSGFRADLNNQLLALFTQHSGNTAPVTTYAFQPWVDTSASPPLYKIRNAGNSAWITIGTLDATFSVGGVTAIANGGTGQTTASAALTALLPSQTGNTDKYLKTDGTVASWALAAAGVSIQVFTSSATYTPTAGKTSFLVFATGGGGGGNGYSADGGSGGGGGTAIRLYNSTEMGANASITVGAGGNDSTSTALGSTGGSTTFDPAGTGLTITGAGGGGGQYYAGGGTGGAGGGSTNSLFQINGQRGINDNSTTANVIAGGASFWAGGQGSGGAGGSSTNGTGGVVVVLEW